MSADVTTTLASWSTTESSNLPTGATAISTNLDDNLRMIQAVARTTHSSGTIASASTTDLSTVNDTTITVSGVTTITAFGTVSAGIRKKLIFSGALTLTHNGTSLILPNGANITTAANDTCEMLSLGSGNWQCLWYSGKNAYHSSLNVGTGTLTAGAATFSDGPIVDAVSAGHAYTIYKRGGASFGLIGQSGVVLGTDATDFALYGYSGKNISFFPNATTTAVGTFSSTGLAVTGNVTAVNGSGTRSLITTDNAGRGLGIITSDWTGSVGTGLIIGSSVGSGSGYIDIQTYSGAGKAALNINSGMAVLDASGNLALGLTPSAWWSGEKVIELGKLGTSIAGRTSTNTLELGTNFYIDSGGNYKYVNTATAASYQQTGGQHTWLTASGTAGNLITWTQAMTLDSSAVLTLSKADVTGYAFVISPATTTSVAAQKFTNSGNSLYIGVDNSANTQFGSGAYESHIMSSTTKVNVRAGGSGGVGLAATATSWGAWSDETMKDIIEPITGAASKVSSMRHVIGKYKDDPDGTRRSFLIAQDALIAIPEAVEHHESGKLGLRYTEVIPLHGAAIAELNSIITELTARIAQLESSK